MKLISSAAFVLALFSFASNGHAVPLTPAQVAEICKDAEDQAHCGRLVEAVQLKRLPGLAERAGDDLKVTLFPSGSVMFRDSVAVTGAKSFALWDYLDRINAVLLYATDGDHTSFVLVQRTSGRQYRLPAEPSLSPDRQRFVTADFCAEGCEGELAVWRIGKDDVRKDVVWKPRPAWIDASANWKDAETIVVEYTVVGEDKPRSVSRKLADAVWTPAQR